VNQCLSEATAAMASGRADGDTKSSALILAGNEILDTYKIVGGGRLRSCPLISPNMIYVCGLTCILMLTCMLYIDVTCNYLLFFVANI
jgi:hypothetical protein